MTTTTIHHDKKSVGKKTPFPSSVAKKVLDFFFCHGSKTDFVYSSEFPRWIPRKLAKSGRPMFVAVGGCARELRNSHEGSVFFTSVFGEVIRSKGPIEMGSGGTADGVPGFCGDVREKYGSDVFLVGWRTEGRRMLEPPDPRYDVTLVLTSAISVWEREVHSYFNMLGMVKNLNPEKKIVFMVFGGGEIATIEALYAIEEGYPIVIVKGSGGTADSFAENRTITSKQNVHVVPYNAQATIDKLIELLN